MDIDIAHGHEHPDLDTDMNTTIVEVHSLTFQKKKPLPIKKRLLFEKLRAKTFHSVFVRFLRPSGFDTGTNMDTDTDKDNDMDTDTDTEMVTQWIPYIDMTPA